MSNRLKPLTSLSFIICLILLMLNDFYLKTAFHNILTGKLSDFCGLFIFPIFWSVFFPKRKLAVFVLTGLLFIYWKSSYSSIFIDFFSSYFLPIQRVVDYTDLLALMVLPLAWFGFDNRIPNVNFNPAFISVIAFFAFCATSMPYYIQNFEQPQYVLFKSSVLPDSNNYRGEFAVYPFDSLLVVEVKELTTVQKPGKDDDYNKNLIITDLDKDVFTQMQGIKSLMPANRITNLTVKTNDYQDSLRFSGGRLDGRFIRKNGNTTLIEGFYKNGIEDSVWTYRDQAGTSITKKTFIKGEKTQIQKFDSSKLVFSHNIDTRADTITWKYIQLGILTIMAALMIFLIIKNYRTIPQTLAIKLGWRFFLCLVLPISVWLAQILITVFIPDHYTADFGFIFNFIVIYITTLPLFIVVVSWIKLKRQIDILWYVLLFAFLYTLFLEYQMLQRLSI